MQLALASDRPMQLALAMIDLAQLAYVSQLWLQVLTSGKGLDNKHQADVLICIHFANCSILHYNLIDYPR